MRIAFDAKRAYQNNTGLGNYSRSLISSLAALYPQHDYYLMAPKQTEMYSDVHANMHTITPSGIFKVLSSLWRSNFVTADLKKLKIDVYHGLSNEIPAGIQNTGIKSVVSIHDLIFERYPKQYKAVDNAIYRKKFSNACKHADKVIAISEQTKQDIIQYYGTPADKIAVCYQSCNTIFEQQVSNAEKQRIKLKYKLPETYFLYVGSVIERKNLLTICKALKEFKAELNIPLVVIGIGGEYMQQVKAYIAANGLANNVIFLSEQEATKDDVDFKSAKDFPTIYQSALAMIYPSIYEGFGIPILEAMWSSTPVITSSISCMPETGGDAVYYIDPFSTDDMIKAMRDIAADEKLRNELSAKGLIQAQKFTPAKCAAAVMQVYESL
ncbi:MAG: glycosyltransferase family 4 protein [Flavipsychrobacter sp.]